MGTAHRAENARGSQTTAPGDGPEGLLSRSIPNLKPWRDGPTGEERGE